MAALLLLRLLVPLVTLFSLSAVGAAAPASARLVRSHGGGDEQRDSAGWVASDGAVLYARRGGVGESGKTALEAEEEEEEDEEEEEKEEEEDEDEVEDEEEEEAFEEREDWTEDVKRKMKDLCPVLLKNALDIAVERAKMWPGLWSSKNAKLLDKWLGVKYTPSPQGDAVMVVERLNKVHSTLRTIRFELPAPGKKLKRCAKTADGGRLAGYALIRNRVRTVYLCGAFFEHRLDKNLRAALLLHEALHCLGTTDLEYTIQASENLRPKDRRLNTQNYLYFAAAADSRADVGVYGMAQQMVVMLGTAKEVDCSKLPGKFCKQQAGFCKVLVRGITNANWKNCNEYCQARDMDCRHAAFVNSCGAKKRPRYTCDQSGPSVCWCKQFDSMYLPPPSTETTSPAPRFKR